MTPQFMDIPVRRITGAVTSLSEYKGEVLMIVNVASQCGLTPQYSALEELYQRLHSRGLTILGFPANNFAGQEPGTNEEIETFCLANFGVSFPMFEKISVAGQDTHPLYKALIDSQPKAKSNSDDFRQHLVEFGVTPNAEPEVLWNFEKFLVSRTGKVVARFAPEIEPNDPVVLTAIEKELAAA